MQFNTLRRLGSISGRTIAAIALSSATVLALAPSAKAGSTALGAFGATVDAINDISYAANSTPPTIANLESTSGYLSGQLTARNNSGTSWTIKAYSTNGSLLKGNTSTPATLNYTSVPYTVTATNYISADGVLASNVTLGSSPSAPTLLYTGVPSNLLPVYINIKINATQSFSTVKADAYTDTITYIIANGS
jgi:hypothetical protein